jgi:hypothetical protein
VATPFGNVDLLTSSEIVEVKEIGNWKGAIGQVLMYGLFFPDREKVVYLFGNEVPANWDCMTKAANDLGIRLDFEKVAGSNSFESDDTIPASKQDYVSALQILADHAHNPTIALLWEKVEALLLDSLTESELQEVIHQTQQASRSIQPFA